MQFKRPRLAEGSINYYIYDSLIAATAKSYPSCLMKADSVKIAKSIKKKQEVG